MKKLTVLLLAVGVSFSGITLLSAHGNEQHQAQETEVQRVEAGQGQHAAKDIHAGHGDEELEIDSKTIVGEVVDITCYMRHDSRGEQHIKCALFCAKQGMPLGVLEEKSQQIYLVLPPGHDDPRGLVLPFVGLRVKIEGIVYGMGGMQGLEIEDIVELAAVDMEEEKAGGHHH